MSSHSAFLWPTGSSSDVVTCKRNGPRPVMRLLSCRRFVLAAALLSSLAGGSVRAEDNMWSWFSGEWSLTLGGAGYVAPRYEGSDDYHVTGMPLISLGRKGS